MTKGLIFSSLFLLSSHSMALSSKNCTSIGEVKYAYNDRIGGTPPYPGMIISVEEIKVKSELLFRRVNRAPCWGSECHLEEPELTDIIPENFDFSFHDKSKKVFATQGDANSFEYREHYVIEAHLEKDFWMICDSYYALVP